MAIIYGQAPPPPRRLDTKATVVVRFARQPGSPPEALERAARRLESDVGRRVWAYFGDTLTFRRRTPAVLALHEFFGIHAPKAEAARLAEQIRALSGVSLAYVAAGPQPPPAVNETTQPLAQQDYLGPAPAGIDARWAWANALGLPVGFVDVEQGWGLAHADFAAAPVTLIAGVNRFFKGHGSASLGVVVAGKNSFGGVGVAFDCPGRVCSEWQPDGDHNIAKAITDAAQQMDEGDVLLVEAQTLMPNLRMGPVETEPASFAAIQAANDQKIVVVESAGNGSFDLDTLLDPLGKPQLKRSRQRGAPTDSGAIMVAAAGSNLPYVRQQDSNFGSRVDCFAWGADIETCGNGWMGDGRGYTQGFGGTSGASAIIAGAALRLQAWAKGQGGVLSTSKVRTLLSHPTLNTKSAKGATDRIGVMPDLQAIISAQ